MKKAMLFFAAFLFSVSAHAATLNLSTDSVSGTATQSVSGIFNNDSFVFGSGEVTTGNWASAFSVTTDVNTPVEIEWTFNPENRFTSGILSLFDADGVLYSQAITGSTIFTATLLSGVTYTLALTNAIASANLGYDVSITAISEVPLPAAFLLFAPALLGLIALRRKAGAQAA